MATNKEGEMPAWPIPEEWNSVDALNNAGVVLYGAKLSPPCCKIATLMDNFGVNYTYFDGKKKGSDYQKIPVLMIGDKQINDSEIIVRILAPILAGKPLTSEEQELEKMNTSGLMMSLEAALFDSGSDIRGLGRSVGGCVGCLIVHFACLVPCFGISKKIHAKYPDMDTASNYSNIYAGKLDGKEYFHGETAGVIDWSIYGLLIVFRNGKTASYNEFMSNSAISAWNERMSKLCKA